jgi:hypothetical protein
MALGHEQQGGSLHFNSCGHSIREETIPVLLDAMNKVFRVHGQSMDVGGRSEPIDSCLLNRGTVREPTAVKMLSLASSLECFRRINRSTRI